MSVTEVRIADDQMRVIERMSRGGNSAPSTGGGSSIGSIVPDNLFGGAVSSVKNFTSSADTVVNQWREANHNFGISMSNDAFGFAASVQKSRMSMDEFMDSVEFGRSGFTRAGGTMSESAKIFLKISTDMADSGMGDQLKQMGFSQGEYNKLLALTISSSRNLNLQKEEDQLKARQSVMEMATEMDKVAKLTGVSRKEQEDLLEKQRHDQKFQSQMRLNEAKGIDMNTMKSKQVFAEIGGMGDLFKQVATGGARTDEVNAQLALLGPTLSGAIVTDIKEMQSADRAVREAAAVRFDEHMAAASNRMLNDEQINKMTATMTTPISEAGWKLQEGAQKLEGIQKIMREQGVDSKEAMTIAKAAVTAEAAGKAPGTGEKVTGAATTEAWIAGESRFNDLMKKRGEIVEAANASLARLVETSKILDKMQAVNKETGSVFANDLGGAAVGIDAFTKSLREGTATEDMLPNAMKLIEGGGIAIKTMVTNAAEVVLNATGVKIESSALGITSKGEAAGSKAVWGDWFSGPAGLANIREGGPEAVVPYNLVPEFINDMQSKFASMMQPKGDTAAPSTDFSMPNIGASMTDNSLLKDMNDQLNKLNTSMTKLVNANYEILENSSKQYRATKQLSPNLNAR